MKKQPVYHIMIQESRYWDQIRNTLRFERMAFIHRGNRSGEYKCRMYKCSEASILRLAKIQEKLAK